MNLDVVVDHLFHGDENFHLNTSLSIWLLRQFSAIVGSGLSPRSSPVQRSIFVIPNGRPLFDRVLRAHHLLSSLPTLVLGNTSTKTTRSGTVLGNDALGGEVLSRA